ncbi:uncharacterized protein LAESUDRAFT_811197 [Laetiporus sulphureus 93-53]|uniref:Uncharacterized protein n=1 Tax=Laetiporus sulphureus 93-53 TaxID=1314785 RepID=A0A165F876_9APHY|nr:uncharacterized protein LAESUDRAFT_811197 [Laetiporus sulphureus 93-53]KZT08576.1 hypothetical protein LAESUDRAFT_811197 [Laetiporus sulphureus 93-53]
MSTQSKVVKNGREKAEEPTDVDIELKNQKKRLVYSAMSEEDLHSIRKAMASIPNAKELPQSTLHEPNDLIIQPLRTPETKHARIGKGIDSRALKRKRTDEEIETAETRALEEH